MNYVWKLVREERASEEKVRRLPRNAAPPTIKKPVPVRRNPIVYNGVFQVLICREHGFAVDKAADHLRNHHPELSLEERRAILTENKKHALVKVGDVVHPTHPIAAIAELSAAVDAWRCREEGCTFTCRSSSYIQRHAGEIHGWRKGRKTPEHWDKVKAQTLTSRRGYIKYFPVEHSDGDGAVAPTAASEEDVADDAGNLSEDEDLVEQRRLLLIDDADLSLAEQVDNDEHDSDWLRGCGWPTWFADKSLAVIVSAAKLPDQVRATDFYFGAWHGLECVSPGVDELVLRQIVKATDLVLERCEATIRETPRFFRCWLRTWGNSFMAYPYELPKRKASRQKYHSYLRRFVCYLFRAHRLSLRLKERTQDLFGFRLNPPQQQMVTSLWSDFASNSAIFEGDASSESGTPILEHLFQLLVMLWTDSFDSDTLAQNPVINYSGVLGIHPYDLSYRRAWDYTPYAAALIWLGRLIMMEYALPLKAYTHLSHVWPSRAAYPDQVARLRDEIRPRYLQRGSFSPVGYLIERLQHGRATADREGPRTQISWSADGQVLQIDDKVIRMNQFRTMVHGVIVRAQQQTQDLLFGWSPEVDLSNVHDDLVCARPRFSFLQHPQNQLQHGFRELKKRAFGPSGPLAWDGAGRQRVVRYLRDCDRLVRFLYAGTHVSSGMPARCEELRKILWANSPNRMRNVFVHKGKLILISAYNKAITHHNNSFYVVRTPCPIMQRLLFIFLVFIRPFRDHLSRQLRMTSTDTSNIHVFAVHSEAVTSLTPAQCLQSLRASTLESPFVMNIPLYRQIAVSIAKRHLPQLAQPFDPNFPHDQRGILQLLAYQTGHQPQTQARSYALEKEYPSRLQPSLFTGYDINSSMWHEFNLIRAEDTVDLEVDLDTRARYPPYRPSPDQDRSRHDDGDDPDVFGPSSTCLVKRNALQFESRKDRSPTARAIREETRHEGARFPLDNLEMNAIGTHTPSRDHKRKHVSEDTPESPTSIRIQAIQSELNDILYSRSVQKRRRAVATDGDI